MSNQFQTHVDKIARECIAVRLRMLTRKVSAVYDTALRPLNLKVSQMNILIAVARMKVARPAKISQVLKIDASTLSRNIERMRTRGWLEIVPDDDARVQPVQVSAAGKKLLEQALPRWEAAQKKVEKELGKTCVAQIKAAARLE